MMTLCDAMALSLGIWPFSLRSTTAQRSLGELMEVRIALLIERGDALLRLRRVVEQFHRMKRKVADPADVIGVGVEGTLCERDGRWRSLRQLVGPILDGSVELCSGNDLVDQAHLACLHGSVALVEEPDLARLLVPDMTGQEGRAPPGVDRTNFGANLTELGVIGGNGQIAQRCEHVAAANRKAVDPRDHGFWYVADQALD